MTEIKHEWRQLAAEAPTSYDIKYAPDEALAKRVSQLEKDFIDYFHAPVEDVVDEHTHPDLDKKIADVHETMTAVLKKSLTDQKCTQSLAHDNLKAAFRELANRLESQKKDHADLSTDVDEHGTTLGTFQHFFDSLSADLEDVEKKVLTLEQAPPHGPLTTFVVHKVRNWQAYLAIFLALLATLLHFVPLK